MIDMAQRADTGYMTAKDISAKQEISEKYLESILTSLSKAGLLSGVRGKGGGYRFTKPLEEYHVGEIIRAVEVSLAPVACLEEGASCARAAECQSLPVWHGLEKVVNDYLDSIALKDLLKDSGTV